MYIPSHQYKKVQYLPFDERGGDGQFVYEDDNTPFSKNQYIELTNGDLYDVPSDDLEKGIFDRARKIKTNAIKDIRKLVNFLIPFIPKRKQGKTKIKRLFVKHKVTGKILEVDSDRYAELFTEEASHLAFGEMDWYIAGPIYDINTLNILQEGTTTKNARELDKLERTLPGIKSYVRDLTFLSDPQYVDQKPQPAQRPIILPSPS